MIFKQSMSFVRASQVDRQLDSGKPFYSRVEMIESIAALCALHKTEVVRKVQSANKEVFKVLWSR